MSKNCLCIRAPIGLHRVEEIVPPNSVLQLRRAENAQTRRVPGDGDIGVILVAFGFPPLLSVQLSNN